MDELGLHSEKAGHLTYRDYKSWPQDERIELIAGNAWRIPAPTWRHQQLSMILSRELSLFAKANQCRAFTAPTDIFLPEANELLLEGIDGISTIVQPDLGVVCDQSKIVALGVLGMPEMLMEIISPKSATRDIYVKKDLYERHGCREYWIWDPNLSWVIRYSLRDGQRWDDGIAWGPEETADSEVLSGFQFELSAIMSELSGK